MVSKNINDRHSALLAAWLEGKLDSEQQQEFEALCTHNKAFAELVEQANYLSMLSDTHDELDVPEWDKANAFRFPEKTRWWHWQGLPITSLACSVVAIFMVLSGINMSVDNGRFSLGFGSSVSEQQINQIVQNKLEQYQQSNQELLSQYIDSMHEQQLQASTQLTQYLLTSSRQERREDFAELIKFVNQQRYDDQVFYARQLNELQQEINSQTGLQVNAVRSVSDLSFNE